MFTFNCINLFQALDGVRPNFNKLSIIGCFPGRGDYWGGGGVQPSLNEMESQKNFNFALKMYQTEFFCHNLEIMKRDEKDKTSIVQS